MSKPHSLSKVTAETFIFLILECPKELSVIYKMISRFLVFEVNSVTNSGDFEHSERMAKSKGDDRYS